MNSNSLKYRIKMPTLKKFFSVILFLLWISLILVMLRNTDKISFTLLICILLVSLYIIFRDTYSVKINNLQKWWLIFIGYGFIITLFNSLMDTVPTQSGVFLIKQGLIIYILTIVCTLLYVTLCDRLIFLKLVRNFISITSLLGIYEIVTKKQPYINIITSQDAIKSFQDMGSVNAYFYRLTLFFYHPIFYGVLLNIAIIILLYLPFKSKIFQYMFLITIVLNLIFTQSRSSWVALLFIVMFFVVKELKQNKQQALKKILIAVFIIAIISVVIINVVPELRDQIVDLLQDRLFGNQNDVGGARMFNWSLLQYPNAMWIRIIGGGNGYAISLLHAHPTLNGWEDAIDNQYLTFLLNYGIVGIMLFGVIIVKTIKLLFNSKNKLNKIILLSLLNIIISGIFYEYYVQGQILFLNFILMSMLKDENAEK